MANSISIKAWSCQTQSGSPAHFSEIFSLPQPLQVLGASPAREVLWGNGNHWMGRLGNADQFSRQIAKLSTTAKLTQARYGTSSQPASLLFRYLSDDCLTASDQYPAFATDSIRLRI